MIVWLQSGDDFEIASRKVRLQGLTESACVRLQLEEAQAGEPCVVDVEGDARRSIEILPGQPLEVARLSTEEVEVEDLFLALGCGCKGIEVPPEQVQLPARPEPPVPRH